MKIIDIILQRNKSILNPQGETTLPTKALLAEEAITWYHPLQKDLRLLQMKRCQPIYLQGQVWGLPQVQVQQSHNQEGNGWDQRIFSLRIHLSRQGSLQYRLALKSQMSKGDTQERRLTQCGQPNTPASPGPLSPCSSSSNVLPIFTS
ncbi:hypothetical protein FGO68_gene17045 [Halteria grandinella]|uniref:Uncharacterized protein n=1 Tax=Halteria grandinella TaxID=5974 RepID=A0A8J8N9K0_HALGN|nr:hypothetical protein FGO68_gene17045 [Halteria grandinella]